MADIEKSKNFEIKKPEFKSSTLLDYTEKLRKVPDVIKRPNCKFCNSPNRAEAEEKYEETGNARAVYRFLADDKKEDISCIAVENHLKKHYFSQKRNELLKDYAENFEQFVVLKRDKRSQLLERIAILNKEMYELAAMSQYGDLDERRKSSESIKKIAECILAHEKEIELMDESMKPVDIVIKHLQQVISDEIKGTNSEEVKRALMNVIDKCYSSLKDVFVETD